MIPMLSKERQDDMRNNVLTVSTRPLIALIALVTLGVTGFVEPSMAKPMTCNAKYIGCTKRCFVANDDNGSWRCIERTCEHQFKNCISDAAGGSDRTGTGAKGRTGGKTGPIVRDKRTPRRGVPSAPLTKSIPATEPRPVVRGSGAPAASPRPAVRDHRTPRAEPRGRESAPFGVGRIRPTSR
jgi:hypothetical protein